MLPKEPGLSIIFKVMGFFSWLFKSKKSLKSQGEVPYINLRKITKTGRFRARGSDFDRERSYFGIDKRVFKISDISENTKKVYTYLSRIADKNGYCFPFHKTIAKRCNISTSTVSKTLKELERKGLLIIQARRSSRRGGSSNLYQVKKIEQNNSDDK